MNVILEAKRRAENPLSGSPDARGARDGVRQKTREDDSRESNGEQDQDQDLGLPLLTGKAGEWWTRGLRPVRMMENQGKFGSTDLRPNAKTCEGQGP